MDPNQSTNTTSSSHQDPNFTGNTSSHQSENIPSRSTFFPQSSHSAVGDQSASSTAAPKRDVGMVNSGNAEDSRSGLAEQLGSTDTGARAGNTMGSGSGLDATSGAGSYSNREPTSSSHHMPGEFPSESGLDPHDDRGGSGGLGAAGSTGAGAAGLAGHQASQPGSQSTSGQGNTAFDDTTQDLHPGFGQQTLPHRSNISGTDAGAAGLGGYQTSQSGAQQPSSQDYTSGSSNPTRGDPLSTSGSTSDYPGSRSGQDSSSHDTAKKAAMAAAGGAGAGAAGYGGYKAHSGNEQQSLDDPSFSQRGAQREFPLSGSGGTGGEFAPQTRPSDIPSSADRMRHPSTGNVHPAETTYDRREQGNPATSFGSSQPASSAAGPPHQGGSSYPTQDRPVPSSYDDETDHTKRNAGLAAGGLGAAGAAGAYAHSQRDRDDPSSRSQNPYSQTPDAAGTTSSRPAQDPYSRTQDPSSTFGQHGQDNDHSKRNAALAAGGVGAAGAGAHAYSQRDRDDLTSQPQGYSGTSGTHDPTGTTSSRAQDPYSRAQDPYSRTQDPSSTYGTHGDDNDHSKRNAALAAGGVGAAGAGAHAYSQRDRDDPTSQAQGYSGTHDPTGTTTSRAQDPYSRNQDPYSRAQDPSSESDHSKRNAALAAGGVGVAGAGAHAYSQRDRDPTTSTTSQDPYSRTQDPTTTSSTTTSHEPHSRTHHDTDRHHDSRKATTAADDDHIKRNAALGAAGVGAAGTGAHAYSQRDLDPSYGTSQRGQDPSYGTSQTQDPYSSRNTADPRVLASDDGHNKLHRKAAPTSSAAAAAVHSEEQNDPNVAMGSKEQRKLEEAREKEREKHEKHERHEREKLEKEREKEEKPGLIERILHPHRHHKDEGAAKKERDTAGDATYAGTGAAGTGAAGTQRDSDLGAADSRPVGSEYDQGYQGQSGLGGQPGSQREPGYEGQSGYGQGTSGYEGQPGSQGLSTSGDADLTDKSRPQHLK